jgi:hypothetical protein
MLKVLSCELVSREEYYDVRAEGDNGVELFYTICYHKEENVGWANFEVLDDNGNDVPEGALRDAIIEAFETCDAH